MSRTFTDYPRQGTAQWVFIIKEKIHHVSALCWVKHFIHGHGEEVLLPQRPEMTLLTAGVHILHT